MPNKEISIALTAVLAIFTATVFIAATRAAAQEKVLHSFGNQTSNGLNPYSSLIFDASGNLYGTTTYGGPHNVGTVFELTPKAGGGWAEKVLYSFGQNSTDASIPYAGLVFDAAGNLYGTTMGGGAYSYGTVFELTPAAGGRWTEQVLHSFNRYSDGNYPLAGLAIDAAGNLYGTTSTGGFYDYGTLFKLSSAPGGSWTLIVLHAFNTPGGYGGNTLILDDAGNLYGTTYAGGPYSAGTVFELVPTAGGKWAETVLRAFNNNGKEGATPYAGLIFDTAGNLYGTTYAGGNQICGGYYGCGTVFELTPTANGHWTEKILHNFIDNGTDGFNPNSSLIIDAAGNLYGTTFHGGSGTCAYGVPGYYCGTVFELTPQANGVWTEKLLHAFINAAEGWEPYSGLVSDAAGNLYGTTINGGPYGYGIVFEITP